MSHFGSGGQFDDAEGNMERRIQDELRARQQASAAASRLTGALAGHGGFTGSAADHFVNSLLAETAASSASSPYYAQRAAAAAAAAAHSPFARPYVLGQQAYGADAVAASLYARQRAQYAYGAAAPSAADRAAYAYSMAGAGHDIYGQHFARPPPEQMTLIDRAAAYNAQQRQAEQATAIMGQGASPTTSATINYMQKATATPGASPKTGARPPPGTSSPTASTPGNNTVNVEDEEDSDDDKSVVVPATEGYIDEEKTQKWYAGCIPLGVEDDKYWLSELQVYLRANFAETFAATEEDIAAPMHGRNKPIALGQVGIRCMHCKHENPALRGQQATSYPSLISGIYNSVQQMLRLHLDCCQSMPPDVRNKIEQLKLSSSSRGGRKQYWVDCAKRQGLVDTPHGIHFGRDPFGPLPPLSGPSVNSKEGRKRKELKAEDAEPMEEKDVGEAPQPPVDDRPLVFPEDKSLISDYLYLTLEQMCPCVLMEADRVGCYKTRKIGFPGLACRHCVGQAGCGRYFPASEASLSQTTTSQTIMNHVRNCRRCPVEIRENLELMKRARMGPDGKRADKPKHGGRKVFFNRLWCRIQGLPLEVEKPEPAKEKKRAGRPKKTPAKKGKKKQDIESDNDSMADEEEEEAPPKLTESSDEDSASESSRGDEEEDNGEVESPQKTSSKGKSKSTSWSKGCVRLTKPDDPHWLTEMQCFARSDLVEVFSYAEGDSLEGYTGRKEPAIGQVGIRCVFCKRLEASKRPAGCIAFPDNLPAIHTKVMDMLRLHFHSCPSMAEDTKETFKTLRGFGAKVSDDSQQYWVDSARDIGLSNIPPGGPGEGWGITFRRDPLQPSPCDELDREAVSGNAPNLGKMYLVKPPDRGICTDQVLLMMRQVKVCTFQKKDRRGGPGSRGRDRVIGFPGLSCKHCATKNNIGRYFPVSAKNLTDNTANSLQSHVATCSRCPEAIRASIAYLSHRSILQKAELSGSWKKAFFKKIWERLHVERSWSDGDGVVEEDNDAASVSSEEEEVAVEDTKVTVSTPAADTKDNDESGTEEEKIGGNMNALIKAAAIWLTEQDQAMDTSKAAKSTRGRTLPGKRSATSSPRSKSRSGGSSLTSGKRRRVHF
eukprot:Nitzschia sp. Nitz4//scaffold11_size288233//216253//219668//NITZ4_000803-RA/size288233-snap-gene-0.57-mRNA-1//-1//CDS//3329534161//7229//frame0